MEIVNWLLKTSILILPHITVISIVEVFHFFLVLCFNMCYTFVNAFEHLLLLVIFIMENQTPNQFPSFGNAPQPSQGPSVPPPPSGQEQVGIRTMESDAESIHQSGGEQPQSQIIDAGNSFSKPSQPNNTFSFQPPFQQPGPSDSPSFSQGPAPEEKKPSSTGRTILIIVGIVVVAVAVGFGVFYLVQSLNSTPAVPTETTTSASLPVSSTTPESNSAATTSPIQEVVLPPAPAALVHASVFGSSSVESVVLASTDLSGVKSAIASSSQAQKLVSGSIKDLAFVTNVSGSSTPVEATTIVGALFPSISSGLSSLIDRDITPWLYGDKSGGNKLGLVIPLKDGVTGDQVKTAFSALESNPQDVLNIFIPTVKLPTTQTFKEGLIGEVMVRYLAISTSNQQVFEYVPVSVSGKGYLVITSSYNQMVDVLKRLNAKVLTVTTNATPQVMPVITSTSTATTSTSTATTTP